jgi:hypothetical protein
VIAFVGQNLLYCFAVTVIFIEKQLGHQLRNDHPELKILSFDHNYTRFGDRQKY